MKVNYGPAKGAWILPGGKVESGESIPSSIVREVKEETGLSVEFSGVVGFRQRLTEVMDFYFICLCELEPDQSVDNLKAADIDEISEVRFWQVNEALTANEVRPNTRKAIQMGVHKRNQLKRLEASDVPGGDYLFC